MILNLTSETNGSGAPTTWNGETERGEETSKERGKAREETK